VTGHRETDYLARARTEAEARAIVGALKIEEAKRLLDQAIADRGPANDIPYWDIAPEREQ
jgi:hypothetical protein